MAKKTARQRGQLGRDVKTGADVEKETGADISKMGVNSLSPQITKLESRPTGTPASENVDITNLPKEQRQEVQTRNALIGQQLEAIKENNAVTSKVNDILLKTATPEAPKEQGQQQPQPTEAPQTEKEKTDIPVKEQIKNTFSDIGAVNANKSLLGAVVSPGALETAGAILKQPFAQPLVSQVAQAYDFIYSLTQGGKGIEQKEAESTIEKIESELNADLNLVRTGQKDAYQVKNKIALAESAINRLEQSEKGLSGLNLRHFLLDGKDVQARLIIARENLEDYKLQLALAEQQGIIAKARAGL